MPWTSEYHLLEARTQLLTAMIVMELAVALCMRSLKYPLFKVGPFKNKYLWYAILRLIRVTADNPICAWFTSTLRCTQPELIDWAIAALSGAIIFATLEIGKYVTSRKKQ